MKKKIIRFIISIASFVGIMKFSQLALDLPFSWTGIFCLIGFSICLFIWDYLIVDKSLQDRIKALNFYSMIQQKYINAIEAGIDCYRFLLTEKELAENKEYIDFYRKKYRSIVYKIQYTLDESNFYKCKFIKAYDLKEKEWIDEQAKTMHLFKSITWFDIAKNSFIKDEIPITFNDKNYICKVTSFIITDETNEDDDKMIEIDLQIIKELDNK